MEHWLFSNDATLTATDLELEFVAEKLCGGKGSMPISGHLRRFEPGLFEIVRLPILLLHDGGDRSRYTRTSNADQHGPSARMRGGHRDATAGRSEGGMG